MWLIDCRELALVEVESHVGVRYAILSHTWEVDEEVQFDEFRNRTATTKRGWDKIRNLCRLAIEEGYQFAWCDTCCINKTSSAELTEAINSMFPWYAAAGICYVYLTDYDYSSPLDKMGDSRWFTRGWTLQELVAPTQVRFYDAHWKVIGTKATLSEELAGITSIEEQVLLASTDQDLDDILSQVPIAKRMSWAARRETTRVEDTAYCLLGIFGVNLPLLYGEGDRAFIRLQDEIVKTSNDLSLFAWQSAEQGISSGPLGSYSGVFAQHPKAFLYSRGIVLNSNFMYNSDFTISNKGIKVEMGLCYLQKIDLHVLWLNCFYVANKIDNIGIFLKHQGANIFARAKPHKIMLGSNHEMEFIECKPSFLEYPGANMFARARPHEFILGSNHEFEFIECKPFFLNKLLSPSIARSLDKIYRRAFVIPRVKGEHGEHFITGHVKPEALWDGGQRMFITAGLRIFAGCYQFRFRRNRFALETIGTRGLYIYFGYGYDSKPWLQIAFGAEVPSLDKCDMMMLAGMAGWTSEKLNIGGDGIKIQQDGITVELMHSTKSGEPVYVIDCKVSDEKEAERLWS